MKAEDLKIRCSSISDIMSGVAKKWSVEDSKTCLKKVIQIWRELRWQRVTINKDNKDTLHGTNNENSGLTLLSIVRGKILHKNAERIVNDYLSGELDAFIPREKDGGIMNAHEIIDIKCSASQNTFPSVADTINSDYKYQLTGYMMLTGAERASISYCLVNHSASELLNEKQKLNWKHRIVDLETPEYIEDCSKLEKACIFDWDLFRKENPMFDFHTTEFPPNIPPQERVFEVSLERDEILIASIKSRIDECRVYIRNNPQIFLTDILK